MPPSPTAPRDPLTRDRVLEAALALADAEGLARLSMRNLAARLGVEAMSLYHHVAGKEDLLSGLTDRVIGEIDWPEADDWRTAMRARAISAHRVLLRHGWASLLIVSRVNVGPNMLRYIDRTLGCLLDAGFSLPLADHAWNTMDAHIHGFTLQRLHFPLDPADYATAAAGFLPMLSPDTHPHMRRLTELVATGGHDGLQDLCFGLDLILEGLERQRVAGAVSPPGAAP